jgi:GNAT superfamily N-acetyltransferase
MDDFTQARALFQEYAAWLAVDLCFQGFAEELATLPGAYAPPRGMLMLAGTLDAAIGCIALRPLTADESPLGAAAEVKRLYVRPAARETGLGRRLVQTVIDGARAIGYGELKLDTLERMAEAHSLYAKLGFRECAPYYHNPIAGAVYMAMGL